MGLDGILSLLLSFLLQFAELIVSFIIQTLSLFLQFFRTLVGVAS